LPAGVHLTLTANGCRPILSPKLVPTLVDEQGFFNNKSIFAEKVDSDEIYMEWEAQIQHFLTIVGYAPSHIDSHHHIHFQTPDLFEIATYLAKKYNLPVRAPFSDNFADLIITPDKFFTSFYGENSTMDNLINILDEIHKLPNDENESEDKFFEIVCHPGYECAETLKKSSYKNRLRELEILQSPMIKTAIEKHNLVLANFQDLKDSRKK
ncbi:MAG: ChbG/HpnK family deacetylase, partial [Defluviitaleaceae bacterium]|nr:ChbG/HpnK family deacetylase [Defluviitaleaceae bacterium]